MAEREWTPDQKNAIEARGGTLLVSAAAGSGKTAVLVERVVQRLAALQLLEEVLEQLFVVVERALLALHVVLVVVALGQLRVERADQFGIPRPAQFACGRVVVHRVAVRDDADDAVLDEFGVGIQVFECRQFLLFGQLLTLFGVTRDLHGEDQYLEIEVIGLVDGRHQRFFRRHHVIRARFEMGEQRLDDLYTE